ncbi:MAG: hypothetical protein P8046_08095 [Anaerolineales bacterium]
MKHSDPIFTLEQLEKAIAAQENLRGTLDDTIIDITIAALRVQLTQLNSDQPVEKQRKQVTILMMDVVNSTRLMRELDPEENLAIMDAALNDLAEPVDAHGHWFCGSRGDHGSGRHHDGGCSKPCSPFGKCCSSRGGDHIAADLSACARHF